MPVGGPGQSQTESFGHGRRHVGVTVLYLWLGRDRSGTGGADVDHNSILLGSFLGSFGSFFGYSWVFFRGWFCWWNAYIYIRLVIFLGRVQFSSWSTWSWSKVALLWLSLLSPIRILILRSSQSWCPLWIPGRGKTILLSVSWKNMWDPSFILSLSSYPTAGLGSNRVTVQSSLSCSLFFGTVIGTKLLLQLSLYLEGLLNV